MAMGSEAPLRDPDELLKRVDAAETEQQRAQCLIDINCALAGDDDVGERARLMMTRATLYSRWWKTREVVEDAVVATNLFEQVGETGRALDAASLAAGFAARIGELSLAAELAAKCLSAGEPLDDGNTARVTTQLAVFCCELFDYDRAVEQLTVSLEAYERVGEAKNTYIALQNIASVLLGGVQQARVSGRGAGRYDRRGQDRFEVIERVLRRLTEECPPEFQRQMGVARLRAELLFYLGRPSEALAVLQGAEDGGVYWVEAEASWALVEARCLPRAGPYRGGHRRRPAVPRAGRTERRPPRAHDGPG